MRMLASAVMPATAQIMLLGLYNQYQCRRAEKGNLDVLVEGIELLGGCVLLQQLARDFPLCGQHDAVFGEDA